MAGPDLRRASDHVPERLTPHEAAIISQALADGRVTVVPPAPAMGLTSWEQRFGTPWIIHSNDEAAAAGRSNVHARYAMTRRERSRAEDLNPGKEADHETDYRHPARDAQGPHRR